MLLQRVRSIASPSCDCMRICARGAPCVVTQGNGAGSFNGESRNSWAAGKGWLSSIVSAATSVSCWAEAFCNGCTLKMLLAGDGDLGWEGGMGLGGCVSAGWLSAVSGTAPSLFSERWLSSAGWLFAELSGSAPCALTGSGGMGVCGCESWLWAAGWSSGFSGSAPSALTGSGGIGVCGCENWSSTGWSAGFSGSVPSALTPELSLDDSVLLPPIAHKHTAQERHGIHRECSNSRLHRLEGFPVAL